MYVCPVCGKQYNSEDILTKHYLACWKEKFPNHKSKSAPRSADINTREISNDITKFFASFK